MNVDRAAQVRGGGVSRVSVRLAMSWKVWAAAVSVVVFLIMMFETRLVHPSGLLRCIGVLFLVCMFVSAATLLVVGYLIPPPEPLAKQHSLVNRLNQYFRVVLNGVMFGVAAFWGAIVSIDVSDAMRSSGINGVMKVGWSSVLYPLSLVAMFGLWVISMGLYIDVHRTDPEVISSRCEEIVEKYFGLEKGYFCGWQQGHRVVQMFLHYNTRGWWAFIVVYLFPLLVVFLVMLAWGWGASYFSSILR